MKKKTIVLLLVISMLVCMTSCGSENTASKTSVSPDASQSTIPSPEVPSSEVSSPSTSDKTRTITDMAGTSFDIPSDLSHIITVNSVATQAVLMLGGVDAATTVGRGCFDGTFLTQIYPEIEAYKDNGRFITSDLTTEAVMEFNNTIGESVVLNGNEETINALREAGCYAAYFSVNGPEDLMNSVTVVGSILGGDAAVKAAEYNTYYQKNIDTVSAITGKLSDAEKPTVLFVRGAKDTALSVFQAEKTFPNFWISTAGGINAVDTRGELTWDVLVSIDPDIIITEKVSITDAILKNEALSALSAVQNNKVYTGPFGVAVWTMGSTEEALTILWAAKLFHPDLFTNIDMTAETINYYRTFFDYTPTEEQVASILAGNG